MSVKCVINVITVYLGTVGTQIDKEYRKVEVIVLAKDSFSIFGVGTYRGTKIVLAVLAKDSILVSLPWNEDGEIHDGCWNCKTINAIVAILKYIL